MRRAIITFPTLTLTTSFAASQVHSPSNSQTANIIEDLLKFPAPTPGNVPDGRSEKAKFSWNSPPPDDAPSGYVAKEDELTTLPRLDWPKAEPILKKFAASPMPRRAVLAKTLLYRHHGKQDTDGAALFADLKAVVENQKALGYCRDRA